jgi:hypothetical protein
MRPTARLSTIQSTNGVGAKRELAAKGERRVRRREFLSGAAYAKTAANGTKKRSL